MSDLSKRVNFKRDSEIEIAHLSVNAKIGADINDCIVEALQLAVNEWRNVELKHNDKIYKIYVNDIFGTVQSS